MRTLETRYALALLDLTQDEAGLEKAAGLLTGDAALWQALNNPCIPGKEKDRVLCRLPEDTDDLLSGMNTWTDCHESDWFYLAIQEATNSHDFVTKDRVYESWTDLNRAPDWSRYE